MIGGDNNYLIQLMKN